MTKIYIVPIEPIDQRYTKQWYDQIPQLLRGRATERGVEGVKVTTIDGKEVVSTTTDGAFLNFSATNIYKAAQVDFISRLFRTEKTLAGSIKPGSKFLVTDAWNFVITAIKYQSDLLGIPVEIHGIWHAGAYDPSDILGLKMEKPWPYHAERSWFYSCDKSYFATAFHRDMFLKNLDIPAADHHRAVVSGQPHSDVMKYCGEFTDVPVSQRDKTVMWPHRYNSDKQPEIIEDMIAQKPDFDVMITQKMNLSKEDYYKQLGQSRAVFSCSLHENLGISMMEGCIAGAIPIVPDRCSYREMYLPEFKYPTEWTKDYESYLANRARLMSFINDRVQNYSLYAAPLREQQQILKTEFLNANVMFDSVLGIK